jgi:hypothetical protein
MADFVKLRVVIEGPVPGVALALQRGRDALVPPVRSSPEEVVFEVSAEVRAKPDGTKVLYGLDVHGPPAARFLYVTVGVRAGQFGSPWDRRAKVPLTGISDDLFDLARGRTDVVLEARITGRARDGGPACASVPILGSGWQVRPADD